MAIQPRSTRTAGPSLVTSGVTTSTPAAESRVWYFSTTLCWSSHVPCTVTRRHSSWVDGARSGESTSLIGAGGAFRLVATILLESLRSSSRWNCHWPSAQAAHAASATATANSTQRRLSRKPTPQR